MVKRNPYEQNYYPPVPTKLTRWSRVSLLWQSFRFIVLNIKILRMVRKH